MRVNVTYSTRGFDAYGRDAETETRINVKYAKERTREDSGRYAQLCAERMFGADLGDVKYGPTSA